MMCPSAFIYVGSALPVKLMSHAATYVMYTVNIKYT